VRKKLAKETIFEDRGLKKAGRLNNYWKHNSRQSLPEVIKQAHQVFNMDTYPLLELAATRNTCLNRYFDTTGKDGLDT